MEYADLIWDKDKEKHEEFINNLAPIVLFAYNRLDHIRQTIEALRNNVYAAESCLYVYSDAPKDGNDIESVKLVREYLHQINGFKDIQIIEREDNFGLARNIIDGVTNIVNLYGKIIVLEDDIVTSKWFLKYMNDALVIYENSSEVMAISSFCWAKKLVDVPETFFLRWFCCWGWATWKKEWDKFERNPSKLVEGHNLKSNELFNVYGYYNFWKDVEDNLDGKLYTWAVFFYVTIFLNGGLVLFSNADLSNNIGLDGSGENCGRNIYGKYQHSIKDNKVELFSLNYDVDHNAEKRIVDAFKSLKRNESNIFFKIYNIIRYEGVNVFFDKIKVKTIKVFGRFMTV